MSLIAFLVIIVIISFLIRTVRNILYLVFLWQLKEYRLDRLLAHLKTSQGKKLILGPLTMFKWIIFFGIILGSLPRLINGSSPNFTFVQLIGFMSYFLYWLVWIFEALLNIREFILYRWRKPHLTLKVIFILIVLFVIIYALSHGDFITGIFLLGPDIDRFSGLLIAFVIIIFNLPTFFYKKIIIGLAKKKISQNKNLKVIGITGSYGKTSTKEFLATILSEKFKVAKTPEFTNTDIGIAKYILNELKPDHEIFVVEMGAYKKGEIEAICDMVKPKLGIITGINEQHLELFGSIENTMKTKFELIESLPKDGTAIFNGNNSYCLEMANWAKGLKLQVTMYKSASDIKNIKIFTDHIKFSLIYKNKSYQFRVNLLGKQAIENILAVIYVAESMGMKMDEIQKAASQIVSPLRTMQFVGRLDGMTLVDDTFNANPDGVIATVDYMSGFKGKKILVLTPLIELGEEAEKIHERLGAEIGKICDLILLTNLNHSKAFISGAQTLSGVTKIQIVNTNVGTRLIQDNIDKNGVVVFEGKEAGRILHKLTNNN